MRRLVILALMAVPAAAANNTMCFYPEMAVRPEGTTLVGFVPMPDGKFANVSVRHSSGNRQLDEAAVACVSSWRYDPGSDKDRDWVQYKGAFIAWSAKSILPMGKRVGRPHNCEAFYPSVAAQQGLTGTTALRFTITAEGRVRDTQIAKSSGSDILDDAGKTCAGHWRYQPASDGKKHIESRWYVEIPWTPDDALVTVERAAD
jgi:TonB family protein